MAGCGTRGRTTLRGGATCGGRIGRIFSPYAAPARLTDFSRLPPAYSFVGKGEPFYVETVRYIERLRACGVPAEVDVYPSDMHAFDILRPEEPLSREAVRRFHERFAYAQAHFFAPQKDR